MSNEALDIDGLLVLPHLRIQNANTISSPLTWGFPSMTAFIGLMHALERRLNGSVPLGLLSVGVVCHHFEAQATTGGFTHAFHLTRNPVSKDGGTTAIVEEGRIHLDITLIFGVAFGAGLTSGDASMGAQVAKTVCDALSEMRVAGGSVLPSRPGRGGAYPTPQLIPLGSETEERDRLFRRARRQWLPGFALVSRDDLLAQRLEKLHEANAHATALDAWLDLSRLNHRAQRTTAEDAATGSLIETVEWLAERPPGWIVPIPVGYGALSDVHAPGAVASARDQTTPFCFVESLYSVGQWISPHRLRSAQALLWYGRSDAAAGLYRCANDYHRSLAPASPTASSPVSPGN